MCNSPSLVPRKKSHHTKENRTGATTCSHHQETACCPAESLSQTGSQAFPRWKRRLPPTTTSQGRGAREDSLSRSCQDCLSLPQKPGTDRDLTHTPRLCSAMLKVKADGCPFPYSHNSSGYQSPYRDPIRAAKGLSICSPHAGCVLPRRRVHSILPLSSCSQGSNIKTWINRCLGWRPMHSPRLTIPTGCSLLPPHPASGRLSISIHGAQHLTPSPSAPLVMLHPLTQGTRTPATGLLLPTINAQASSRLQTPD